MTQYFAWRGYYLAVSDTELILKTNPSRPETLPPSANSPLAIRQSKSGTYWQINLPGRGGKPIEIRFAASPDLRRFVTKRGMNALLFKDSPRADEPASGR